PYRHRLFVSAVHGAADLRGAGEDGRDVAGSRRRSRLSAVENLLARDRAAVAARRVSRRAALLHSDRRRVRHPGSARRLRDPDDLTDAVDGVLHQPRLAPRVGRRGRAPSPPGGADRDVSAYRAAPARSGVLMRRFSWFNLTSVALGLAFLYLPIAIL